jgi:hypothetical protein
VGTNIVGSANGTVNHRYPVDNEDSNDEDNNKNSHGAKTARKKQKVWL